jgi:hypothetical protein
LGKTPIVSPVDGLRLSKVSPDADVVPERLRAAEQAHAGDPIDAWATPRTPRPAFAGDA